MKVEPQNEHRWLQKLVGRWSVEGEAAMGPDKPVEKWTADEIVESIGGLWMQCVGRGQMPGGGESTTVMTLGYDPQKQRYVGSFIGSMMTYQWVYEGTVDAAGTKLTLETIGPDFGTEGAMAHYRDVIEFVDDDHRTLTSHMQGSDGQWTPLMSAHYRRKA